MTFDWAKALRQIAPDANVQLVVSLATGLSNQVGRDKVLNRPVRVAHLLAQMATETQGFTKLEESLYYSAKRMTQVWPRRFPTLAAAAPYAANPQALANKTYNGRMGNRPDSDDGWFFRGCGGLHHPGRDEHKARAASIGVSILDFGAMMRDPTKGETILLASISYCTERRVWDDMDRNDVVQVTELINGGQNGIADRRSYLAKAMAATRSLVIA